jgi:PhnB protein
MQINTYLVFDGRCKDAFGFYAKVFGGAIRAMIPHAGTPAAQFVADNWQDKVMHAELAIPGGILMGSDAPPDRCQPMAGFSVSVQVEQPGEADRL